MCKCIEEAEIFNNKEIKLDSVRLSATDVEYVSLFHTSSFNKQWLELDLDNCYVQDRGLHTLCKYLTGSDVSITELWLNYNGLTMQIILFLYQRHCPQLQSRSAVDVW